jgi:hypothetical protein
VRLAALNVRTLKVPVETGPAVSAKVGAPEIDVAAPLSPGWRARSTSPRRFVAAAMMPAFAAA